jgi:hypothetical protein
MDLVLHKRLLALQEENALLRKNLQELSDELKQRYVKAAGKDLHNQANMQGRDFAHGLIARAKGDDHNANLAFAASDRAGRKALKRRSGIERAARLMGKGDAAPADAAPASGMVKTLKTRGENSRVHQTLHTHGGRHYVVSSNDEETLIFPSDKHGNWDASEVGGGDRPAWHKEGFNADDHHTNTFNEFLGTQKKRNS